jgi:hypothetical protein
MMDVSDVLGKIVDLLLDQIKLEIATTSQFSFIPTFLRTMMFWA